MALTFSRIILRLGIFGSACLFSVALAAPTTNPAVVIDQEPAIVHRVMFDRFHKTANMPATRPGEAALTQSDYECAANVTYAVDHEESKDGKVHVMAKIASVKLTLKLTDTIYLPQLAPVELRAHEEGHRVMNEQVYTDGNAVASKVAAQLLQQDWPGDGVDEDAAGKAATDAAVQRVCNEYLKHTAERASQLGDIYDKLTNHGRNTLLVSNAIKLSFLEERKIDATQPVTTQVSLTAAK